MPSYQAADINDVVNTTLRELNRLRWVDIATDIQEFVVLPIILRKERVGFGSGYELQWDVQVDYNNQARHVDLWETDNPSDEDTMQQAKIPWRSSETKYMIHRTLVAMNRSPAMIVRLVETKRHGAMGSLAELMEDAFWGGPTGSNDNKSPYGVDYWYVKTSSTTGGFQTGTPTGFTTVANLDPSVYTNWGNWAVKYTDVTKQDFVKKAREGFTKIQWKPHSPYPELRRGSSRYGIYANYNVIGAIEEVLESQNDSLGPDVASMDGRSVFRRIPFTYVRKLDDKTDDPVFFVDWSVFFPAFLRGEYLVEQVKPAPNQHRASVVYVDMTYNFKCIKRNNLMVLSK